ncbi:MAG: acetyl-CoA carboxylase biotin carboxyl carrier protein [Alphaproteobacteria bacterium]|nr:acetyl-CoA carboxylase biotin carboxyl carrier protein [Alphaproteobacteria bacterium]
MSDSFDIDADLVRKLADLLSETGLGEIEYEDGGKRIRVAMPGIAAPAGVPAPAPAAAVAAPAPAGPAAEEPGHPGAVTAPMVGTVYLAQAPEDPPIVRAGDSVSEGQTLMLIEAMKTFNEVKAPRAGTVTQIAVSNGQPVEFGEMLAVIE